MAFSSTIDSRPTVIGNLLMLTGTFNAAGVTSGTIDLSGLVVNVLASGTMALAGSGSAGNGTDGSFSEDTGASGVMIQCVSGQTGRWWAMGQRS